MSSSAFRDPEPFDWYQRYSGVSELLNKYVKKDDNILVAGAGNSRLSEDMYEDGYQTLTNIDISRVVVDQMIEKYKDKSALTYQQMNVCSLEFPDESFDAVVAKATMDAILCGEGSTANVAKMCQEVSRVLKPVSLSCRYIRTYVSHAHPLSFKLLSLSLVLSVSTPSSISSMVSFLLCHTACLIIDSSTSRMKITPGMSLSTRYRNLLFRRRQCQTRKTQTQSITYMCAKRAGQLMKDEAHLPDYAVKRVHLKALVVADLLRLFLGQASTWALVDMSLSQVK